MDKIISKIFGKPKEEKVEPIIKEEVKPIVETIVEPFKTEQDLIADIIVKST